MASSMSSGADELRAAAVDLDLIAQAVAARDAAEAHLTEVAREVKARGRVTVEQIAQAMGYGNRRSVYKRLSPPRHTQRTRDFSTATRVRNNVTGTVRVRIPATDNWMTTDFPGELVTTSQLEALAEMVAEHAPDA